MDPLPIWLVEGLKWVPYPPDMGQGEVGSLPTWLGEGWVCPYLPGLGEGRGKFPTYLALEEGQGGVGQVPYLPGPGRGICICPPPPCEQNHIQERKHCLP